MRGQIDRDTLIEKCQDLEEKISLADVLPATTGRPVPAIIKEHPLVLLALLIFHEFCFEGLSEEQAYNAMLAENIGEYCLAVCQEHFGTLHAFISLKRKLAPEVNATHELGYRRNMRKIDEFRSNHPDYRLTEADRGAINCLKRRRDFFRYESETQTRLGERRPSIRLTGRYGLQIQTLRNIDDHLTVTEPRVVELDGTETPLLQEVFHGGDGNDETITYC